MNLDDLDALFAELAPPQAAATPPPTPAVEIAAPVVAAASKIAPASPPAKILDNKELSLDDELDALLGETSPLEPFASEAMLVAEEQQATENDIFPEDLASPAPAASAVDNTHGLDDLDALFAELAPPQVAAKPAPTPVIPPIPAATAGDDLDDLDALFTANAQDRAHTPPASPEEKSSAAPATADSSARFQSIEDDLDDILGSVDPATAPASPASRTDDAEDEPVDLSDLGTMSADEAEDFLANIFDTEKNAPKNSTALEADLLDGLDVLDGLDDPIQPGETIISPSSRSPEKQLASSDTDTLDFSMLSVDNPADMPAMPAIEDAPIEDTLLPELDELDKLLQDSLPTPPSPPISQHPEEQAEELAFIEAEGPRPTSFDQDFTEEDIAQAAQELLDEKVRETASIDNVDTDAWLSSLDAILEEEEKEDFPDASSTEKILPLDDDSAVNLDSLLAHLSDSGEQTQHYVYSPQRPHNSQMDANNTASPLTSPCDPTVPTMPFELAYEQELARLQQITDRFTSSLLEADVRIATLTQQAKSEVALESLFRADSPFSASLQHAVGTAVAAELRTHSHNLVAESAPPAADPKAAEVANQVTALELAHQELQAEHAALIEKVCSLEEQLHSLHSQGEAGKNAQQSTQERLSALEDGNKEARLQTVETHVKGQAASTESLEAQCAQLQAQLEAQCQHQANFEQHFQHEVEKAAAAAAARIIREEIAGILAGQE